MQAAAAPVGQPGLIPSSPALPTPPPSRRKYGSRPCAILPRAPEPSPAAFDFLIGRLSVRDDPLARLGAVELPDHREAG